MSILLADIDATCAALGYSDGDKYQAEPDAIQGLKHLIWILRRDLDNHEYRRHLGHSKVLQTDLVYMLESYVQDDEFADVLIRLLVILTNPTLLLYRNGPPKDNHGQKVYMELIEILQGYKSSFTNDKIWAALFGKLQKSLEIDWAVRSEEQSLLIERILVLIRNVLQVPSNPDAEGRADNDASLHDQVIWALHQSGVSDLLLFIISSPDEHQFHLHGLEILCLLYREQTAESLADASLQRSAAEKQRDEQELLAVLRREKQRTTSKIPPGRHSRFGGTFVIRNLKSVSDRDIICHQPLERVMAIDFDREKEKRKRSFRHVKEEVKVERRSAFSVRLCLREYCIEILRSAYNTLVRQVRRVLERNAGTSSHDDSYLLWAIRFFMEFNRLSGLQLELVSESLSVQCFHWVLTRMQHNMDMIVSDKKQARLWAKRLHVALQTFRELLQSLLALQKLKNDDTALALFDMLLNNVCYVMEYRETILHLLMNYNEAHSTKVYLRDVVETANIFVKMMEKFCKDSVVVQDKKRGGKRSAAKKKKTNTKAPPALTEEELSNKWAGMADQVCQLLSNESQLPEEEQPLPFDAASDKSIDDQKGDCLIRIHRMLRDENLDHAVALLRAAREVWPENDGFGEISAAPEDELLLMREIFMQNISEKAINEVEEAQNHIEFANDNQNDDDDEKDVEEEEYGDGGDNQMVERTFKFEEFAKRLLNPKIVRACTIVLTGWQHIPTKSLKAAVTILHRIAYSCSCPAMLYQANLFRIFQEVLHAARDVHNEELRRLGIFIVRKFVETAPNNPKIYAELLFYKTVKEAIQLESGYCDEYETGTKGVWSEEQEQELRLLFEENQRNPETDKDVIDWLLDNMIDKTRTRRGVLKKLKEMGLMFKAPTKKSSSLAQNKNLWRSEDDEELRSLYDQHRLEDDCLQLIMEELEGRRTKQQIIKRMLQLYMIADKSEIMPQKPKKRNLKKVSSENNESEDDNMEEPNFTEENIEEEARNFKSKSTKRMIKKTLKVVKRKIVRTPLDIGTVKALKSQVDAEKYQEAFDWLKECLEDAASDPEEPTEEDDGVPLLPLQDIIKEAMEDKDFQKFLVSLGIQPPVMGIENYWRIPTYLNAADLKLRAKIVGDEDIEVDANDFAFEMEEEIEEEVEEEVEEDVEEEFESKDRSDVESEKDFFDDYKRENYVDKQREKLNSLMYSKSDEEVEVRKPLKEKKKKADKQRKQNKAKNSKQSVKSEDSEDEADIIAQIAQKLRKKKQNPDLSSEEEIDVFDIKPKSSKNQKPKKDTKKKKTTFNDKPEEVTETVNTEAIFEQLKSKRASKAKDLKKSSHMDSDDESDIAEIEHKLKKKKTNAYLSSEEDDASDIASTKHGKTIFNELKSESLFDELKTSRPSSANKAKFDDANSSDDDLNFNSEDYRKRLLELGDSDDDKNNTDDENKTEINELPGTSKIKNRTRRANIIESDSDDDEQHNESTQTKDNNQQQSDGKDKEVLENVDKTGNQASNESNESATDVSTTATDVNTIDEADTAATAADTAQQVNNKRRRSVDADLQDTEMGNEDNDEDAFVIMRRKPTKEEQQSIENDEEPAKRRRLAIIDDDDEDNF